jgi:hypothetical protein
MEKRRRIRERTSHYLNPATGNPFWSSIREQDLKAWLNRLHCRISFIENKKLKLTDMLNVSALSKLSHMKVVI